MNLNQWATKWGIPYAAVEDLRRAFQMTQSDPPLKPGLSEAAIQTQVRLEASEKGGRLWRNNNGACTDVNGNFIRYGLANDSKQINEIFKSSDLIGLRPVTIQPKHLGAVMGIFVAREIKPAGWQYSGTPREKAQLKFIELINALGGDATFATGTGTL